MAGPRHVDQAVGESDTIDLDRQQEDVMHFMHIIPHNSTAKLLFSQCWEHVNANNDKYHAKYMTILPRGQNIPDDEPLESDTDYESAATVGAKDSLIEGYYFASFAEDLQREMVRIGLRVGKGSSQTGDENRLVEILLAKPGDLWSKKLPSIVCRLHLDDQLGLLVIRRPDISKGDVHLRVDMSWVILPPGEGRVLYSESSWIRSGGCEYELSYAIPPSQRSVFLAKRDEKLAKYNHQSQTSSSHGNSLGKLPELPRLNWLPGEEATVHNKKFVVLDTFGGGAFGHIRQGFNIESCQRIARKELRINKDHDIFYANNEVKLLSLFQNVPGVASLIHYHCEHGNTRPCKRPESFYLYTPLAIHDFSKFDWFYGYPLELRLQLLHGPLLGLAAIHEQGIMHRDITVGNILIQTYDPPCAVITDFGKATASPRAMETALGPIHTLAPEVWSAAVGQEYDCAIDIYSLGYAYSTVLGCVPRAANVQITREAHTTILENLDCHMQKHPEEAELVILTKMLMAWDPHERIMPRDALDHSCWSKISRERNHPKRTAAEAGLEVLDVRSISNEGTINAGGPIVLQTQSFGSETQRLLQRKD